MNFLAHLLLAGNKPDAAELVGNLAGDFLSPLEFERLDPRVQVGVRRHQRVDELTDEHPLVAQCRRRVPTEMRRYAGIAVDVFYDHLLSRRWADHGQEGVSRAAFIDRAHATLLVHAHLGPRKLQEALPRMVEQNWLGTYDTLDGMRLTLRRISRRFSRPVDLAPAVDAFATDLDAWQADFDAFFPELRRALND